MTLHELDNMKSERLQAVLPAPESAENRQRQIEQAKADTGRIDTQVWKLQAFVTDMATMGTGTLLAAVLNTALIFLIPRLVSVEDYGYWRMFLLYSGYVGFLHFGFADGALLRWAGRPMADFRHEILPSLKFLFWQQVVVLAPLCVIFCLALPAGLRFVGVAVLGFALIYNTTALLQFGLQGARIFRPVAVSTVAPLGVFLGLVLLWEFVNTLGLGELILFYFLAWALGFAFLWFQTKEWQGRAQVSVRVLAKENIHAGWPIVVANTGVALILYADRMALSWTMSIQNFAQYSLAVSAVLVLVPVIQACYRVFLPHLAGLDAHGRRRAYGAASRFLLLAWSLLLPYFLILDAFVRHFLPGYVPSLEIARLLLLGILFQGIIQILHMSFAYLHGRQARFLVQTATVLAISLGSMSLVAFRLQSLTAVAIVQVTILGFWWMFNEWTLRDLTGHTVGDWARFLTVFTWASSAYWITMRPEQSAVISIAFYYAIVAFILAFGCRDELRSCASFLVRLRSSLLSG